ncbi:MAG: MBL fold metallo-hydrolase [Gemmatimonadota bacterium]|nr:MAG: MBL fold metallo-hydrolase [Gemmatimonadota bacterium]
MRARHVVARVLSGLGPVLLATASLHSQDPVLALADSLKSTYEKHPGLGDPTVHRLGDGVYAVTGLFHSSGDPGVNAGIVFGQDTVVFIDCGMSVVSGQYLWAIASARMTGDETVILVLTHHHSDHVFGMSVFKERGARIIAHDVTAWFLRERGAEYRAFIANMEGWTPETADSILGDVSLSEPDVTVNGDYVLSVGGDELRLLFAPGHVPSELVVYHPGSRTLFAGDAIYEGMPPTAHFGGPAEWRTWIGQLQRMGELDIEAVVPGHGRLGAKALIDVNINHLRSLL